MDRRHRLIVRGASFIGAAALMVAVLWGAGFPPTEWLARVHLWWAGPSHPSRTGNIADRSTSSVQAAPPQSVVRGTKSPSGNDSSISTTPQRMVLVSTSPGRNEREGTARLGTNPDNPQTYVAGAILANGARLAEIHRDRVVLRREDEAVTLYVGDKATPARDGSSTANLAMIGGVQQQDAVRAKIAVDRLSDVIRAMPYYENDLLAGLHVFPGRQSGAFAQLGLKSGDVIVAIDGAPVADPQISVDLLRTLADGAAMTVSVRRDGSTTAVGLDGAIVSAVLIGSEQPQAPMQARAPSR